MRLKKLQDRSKSLEGGVRKSSIAGTSWWIPPLLLFFLLFSGTGMAQDGQQLFRNNCASCHKPTEQKLVGPGLKGVTDRREMDWLLKWTKNSQKMIDEGNEQAVALYEEYDQQIMPAQDLSDNEIKAIYDFIESGGKSAAQADGGDQTKMGGGDAAKAEAPMHISGKLTLYWLVLTALLIVLPSILAVDRALKLLKADRERSAFR